MLYYSKRFIINFLNMYNIVLKKQNQTILIDFRFKYQVNKF
jgi:hypothetical protein